VVADVEVSGADELDVRQLENGLSTAETPYLFGLIPRVLEYSTYDPAVLARDLARAERWFRARGYYEAKVRAARVVHIDSHHVRVELEASLGEPVIVRRVDPAGLALLPAEVAGAAVSAIKIREGEVFDEARFDTDKRALLRVLTDGGYAFAKVEAKARVDIAARSASVSYAIELGRRSRFGAIKLEGLQEIPEGPVRSTFALEEGQLYSTAEVEDAQKALVTLGVFSNVEIREDRSRPESGVVPLTVVVREALLRGVRAGVGGRFDVLRLSASGQLGWESRNFLGGMRRFEVDVQPGATFFPTRIPTDGKSSFYAPTRVLPEVRVSSELRQPSFPEGRTSLFLSADFSRYPVIYPLEPGLDPRREPVLGYNEITASVGAERAFLRQHLSVRPSYNWQAYFPFSYQNDADAGLGVVRVSAPKLDLTLDYRDDPVQPTRGVYLSNAFEVAGYVFRGTVSDVRVRPEVRVYTRGALGKRSVFSARLGFGFLFPRKAPGDGSYGETLDPTTPAGILADLNPKDPVVVRDQQKLSLRAFYSGGPTSNRGYPYRGVGPQGQIGYLVPAATTGVNCAIATAENEQGCIRPLGGPTLWELSLETRFPITGDLHGALFVDASDVSRYVGTIRLRVPHVSPGFGLRYLTLVGPLRLDLGFRPPYVQAIGKKELPPEEGDEGGTILGLPMSIGIALGEAF
jgi:outer membrane protein insertion porin family/translocation and assembly module TamA